jgi:hypothetical protein
MTAPTPAPRPDSPLPDSPGPNWDALGTTLRQRLWDLLRKRAGSTMFDASRPDAPSVRRAADHAREKLLKKIWEIDRLEVELLELADADRGVKP